MYLHIKLAKYPSLASLRADKMNSHYICKYK